MQIECYFCGEDSQGAEGAETSESHQQSQGVKGTTLALITITTKIMLKLLKTTRFAFNIAVMGSNTIQNVPLKDGTKTSDAYFTAEHNL